MSSLSQLHLSAAASYIKPPFWESATCKRKTLTFMHINILSKPLPAFSDPTFLLPCFQLQSSDSILLNIFKEAEAPYNQSQPALVIELQISKICWRKSLLSGCWSDYLYMNPWLQYLGLLGFSVIRSQLTPLLLHGGGTIFISPLSRYMYFPASILLIHAWKIHLNKCIRGKETVKILDGNNI